MQVDREPPLWQNDFQGSKSQSKSAKERMYLTEMDGQAMLLTPDSAPCRRANLYYLDNMHERTN